MGVDSDYNDTLRRFPATMKDQVAGRAAVPTD
jgi:hypothetical protein